MENKATISDQWEAKLRQYQDASPNDENFRIPPMLYSKIQKIVQDPKIRRYTTVDEFLIDALDLFTTWWTRPDATPEMMAGMWKDMTLEMKDEIKKTSPEFYQQMEMQSNPDMQASPNELINVKKELENQVKVGKRAMKDLISGYGGVDVRRQNEILYDIRQTKNDLISYEKKSRKFSDEMKFLKNLKKRKDSLEYDGYPLIWSFYTRLFPVRIALIVLGHIINEQIQMAEKNVKNWWEVPGSNRELSVDFEYFSQRAYEFALFVSNYLRRKESMFNVARNYRISTGLPVPMPEYISPGSPESYEYRKKVESSKLRFIRQFLGRSHFEKDGKPTFQDSKIDPYLSPKSIGHKEFFGGLLNATGLAQFFRDDKGILRIGFYTRGI